MANKMDENYILELLRMPHPVLAKMVWGLQEENRDIDEKSFFSQLRSDTTIEIQKALIRHLSAEIDKQHEKAKNVCNPRDSKRHTVRFSLGSFSISLSMPRIWEK